MDFAALQSELESDPEVLGYTGDNAADAALLNIVDRSRNRSRMTGKEVKDTIESGDWNSRTDAQKSNMLSLFARDDLDPFGIDADIMVEEMSGHAGGTIAALGVARVETVSRIRELEIGFGDSVSEGQVAQARAT